MCHHEIMWDCVLTHSQGYCLAFYFTALLAFLKPFWGLTRKLIKLPTRLQVHHISDATNTTWPSRYNVRSPINWAVMLAYLRILDRILDQLPKWWGNIPNILQARSIISASHIFYYNFVCRYYWRDKKTRCDAAVPRIFLLHLLVVLIHWVASVWPWQFFGAGLQPCSSSKVAVQCGYSWCLCKGGVRHSMYCRLCTPYTPHYICGVRCMSQIQHILLRARVIWSTFGVEQYLWWVLPDECTYQQFIVCIGHKIRSRHWGAIRLGQDIEVLSQTSHKMQAMHR